MATRMQQRRGTSEQWTTVNPVLAEGEIGLETDTNKFKIGNGTTAWATLGYASLSSADLANYATEEYVDDAVSALVGAAPGLLDTIQELSSALGDDENFATNITNSINAGDAATLAAAEDYTDAAVAAIPAPDFTGYATELYADQAEVDAITAANAYTDAEIASIPAVDLTGYATETYVDNAIAAIPEVDLTGYATETYVNSAVAGIVDAAPEALNTLNELAAALGDDENFATTVTNSIAAKADASHEHGIEDITDFSITSPVDSSFLKYNASTSKWEDAIIIDGGNA